MDASLTERLAVDLPHGITRLKAFKLVRSALSGDVTRVTRLLADRVSVNYIVNLSLTHACTALVAAVDQNHVECARLLIGAKANVNLECKYGAHHESTHSGRTPLEHACAVGSFECADLLLDNGADASHEYHCLAWSHMRGCDVHETALHLVFQALARGRSVRMRSFLPSSAGF